MPELDPPELDPDDDPEPDPELDDAPELEPDDDAPELDPDDEAPELEPELDETPELEATPLLDPLLELDVCEPPSWSGTFGSDEFTLHAQKTKSEAAPAAPKTARRTFMR